MSPVIGETNIELNTCQRKLKFRLLHTYRVLRSKNRSDQISNLSAQSHHFSLALHSPSTKHHEDQGLPSRFPTSTIRHK